MIHLNHTRNSESGFLMLNIAIAVIVAGFLSIAIMRTFVQEDERNRRIENEQKMNAITDAIAKFVHEQGRYPSPASITRDIDETSFGTEVMTARGIIFEDATGAGQYTISGSVPVITLGLPADYMVDSYGNRFTYAAYEPAINPPASPTTKLPMQVFQYDNTGNLINTINANFVLISHGRDGKGAYRGSGNSHSSVSRLGGFAVNHEFPDPPPIACPDTAGTYLNGTDPGLSDVNNCINPTEDAEMRRFVDAPYSPQNDIMDVGHFDDQIVYTFGLKDTSTWAITTNDVARPDLTLQVQDSNMSVGSLSANEKLTVDGDMVIERLNPASGNALTVNGLQTGNIGDTGTLNEIEVQGEVYGVFK